MPRDRTTGLPLPSPVDPGSTVCVQLAIPNAPEYRQAFRGVIAGLGKYWAWSLTVGQSADPALEAAELWRAAAQTITYLEECPEDMSCADVADCIENDPSARAAVTAVAGQAAQPGTTTTPGERLPDSKWAANLTPTDDCDPDVFWAQCSAFVDYAVTAGIDFLEILETFSNNVEAAAFIELAPVIGTLVDEAQIDQVIAFIDWCLEIVQEAFVAADTQPNRQAIACALFCAMRADCELSLEGAFEVINDRLGGVLTPSDLNSTTDLITAAVTIATNPAFPLDTWLAIVLALGRTMGYLGVQGINQALNMVLKVAVNDANDDWVLLCTDCPTPEETCEDNDVGNDFRVSNGGFVESTGGYGEWHSGEGWGVGSLGFTITVEKAFTTPMGIVRMFFNENTDGAVFLRNTLANGFGTYTGPIASGVDGGLYWYEFDMGGNTTGLALQANPADADKRLVKWCGWYA